VELNLVELQLSRGSGQRRWATHYRDRCLQSTSTKK